MVGFELAGVVGINPEPFSLRELFWMAESKLKADWQREASLAAFIGDRCGWSKTPTDPNNLIPERYRQEYEPVKVTARSNRQAWRLLEKGLMNIKG